MPGKRPRVYARTYGCQMNHYDTGKMLALLLRDGWELAGSPEEAELVLVNTCSVREKPERKLASLLGRLRRLKQRRGTLLAVTGCTAQQAGDRIYQRYPWVDLVAGPDAVHRIHELVREAREHRVLDTRFLDTAGYPFVAELAPDAGHSVTGLVTIQKGCDNRCTYCIVPMTRGPEASRPAEQVLREVRELAERGVRDFTLIGQNVNTYGRNCPDCPSFAELLRRVLEEPRVWRLRFTSSHPRDLDDETISVWREDPRLASHLHLPVQSGSNRVLRRMARGYTRERFLDRVRALQEARPGISITTDFIVGFPGEADEDFEQTLSLMEEAPIDGSFSFRYSPRPGTAAERLHRREPVPVEVARERLIRLQALQDRLSERANQRLVGSVQEVLVEGVDGRSGALRGRTSCFRLVLFMGPAELVGRLVPVRVLRARVHTLEGELAAGEAA